MEVIIGSLRSLDVDYFQGEILKIGKDERVKITFDAVTAFALAGLMQSALIRVVGVMQDDALVVLTAHAVVDINNVDRRDDFESWMRVGKSK